MIESRQRFFPIQSVRNSKLPTLPVSEERAHFESGGRDQEIGIGGAETTGLGRGPAYQIFESHGTLLQTQFVLNVDFLSGAKFLEF